MASPELTALSIENAPKPEVTSAGQAAAERIAANRQLRDSGMSRRDARRTLNGSVSANQLAEGAATAPVTEPVEAPPVNRGVIDRSAQHTDEVIRATTQESKDLDKVRAEMAAIAGEGSLQDMFTGGLADAGVPDWMKELTDIQLQLADRGTESAITQSRIEGAAGQTLAAAGREVTQEQREAAIRDAGLAARAQVLQGNIETASNLVNQAVTLAYQDRTLRNTNLINQINDLRGVVDEQTQQILDREQRKYEEDQAEIERVQAAVDAAMASGAATSEDVKTLTNPKLTDEERLAAAQAITARAATESRNLEMEGKRASNAASWALANQRNEVEPGSTYNTPTGEQIEIPTYEDWAEENGGRLWQLGGTEDAMQGLRQEYDDEIEVMKQAAKVASLSPLAREVVNNPQAYYDFTATQKGQIFEELSKKGLDTNNIIAGKKRPLPATQVTEITQAQGVKEDVQTLYDKLLDLPGTGPVGGRLQALDQWNAQRVEIEALITSIVPGLARGIFNEVGVLTDQDVERYRNTLANPNMTDEQIDLLHNQTMSKINQSLDMGLNNYSLAGYAVDKFIEDTLPESSEAGGTETDPLGLNI